MRAAGVGVEHLIQRGHHVLDPLHGPGIRLLQALLHAAELAVEHLPAQQVLELLEGLPGRIAAPVVVVEPPDRPCGVARQLIELGLAQPGLVGGVREQLGAFLPDRGVQQRARLLQDAVKPTPVAQLALPLADPAEQVVQAFVAGHAPAQQIPQCAGRIGSVEHRVAELIHGAAHVVRRL